MLIGGVRPIAVSQVIFEGIHLQYVSTMVEARYLNV